MCDRAKSFEMFDVRMNAAIRQQPNQMHGFIVLFRVSKGLQKYRIFVELLFFNGLVYFNQVLIDNAACANIHVADF